jgi:hypothetical protein
MQRSLYTDVMSNTRSKRPTPQQVRDHYRADIEALPTPDLLRMVRGDFEPGTPAYFSEPMRDVAIEVAQARGIAFPTFTAILSV